MISYKRKHKYIYGAFFIILGIIFPQIFHLFGAGKIFLPMHIPIILCSFILGLEVGIIVGFITPLLSSLLTGMPPIMPPIAFEMAIELSFMGWIASYLFDKKGLSIYKSLIITIITGRIIYIIYILILGIFLIRNINITWSYIFSSLIISLPGIILQITIIPLILSYLIKYSIFKK